MILGNTPATIRFLEYQVPYYVAEDVVRWLSVALAGACVFLAVMRTYAIRMRQIPVNTKKTARVMALAVYSLAAALQEVQQMGRPMLWWRLPLLTIASAVAAISIYTPDEYGQGGH